MISLELNKEKMNEFKSIINYLSDLFIESQIELTRKGIKIAEMDPSNVFGIEMLFKHDIEVTEKKEENQFGIKLKDLNNAIRRCKENAKINFGDNIQILFEKKEFNIPIIDLYGEKKEFKVPELPDTKIRFELNKTKIKEILEDCKGIGSESIRFTTKNKTLTYTSEGYNNNSIKAEVNIGTEGESNSKFSQDFLEQIFQKIPGEEIKIGLGKDYPLLIILETNNFNIKGVLAPRVDNE